MAGCQEDEPMISFEEAEYNGVFLRLQSGSNSVESPVALTLSNGTFTGVADSLYYPAICKGSYKIKGNTISFTDSCYWTANFDWTFILSGTYTIREEQNETVLIQELSPQNYNIYRLQK